MDARCRADPRDTIDGGPLKGGAPRVVWQTLGADPRSVSARAAAKHLDQLGRACHLVWNPLQGEIVQLIPMLRAGRLLGWPDDLDHAAPPSVTDASGTAARGSAAEAAASGGSVCGGSAPGETVPGGSGALGQVPDRIAEANVEGRLCVQICVVAFAWDPFTSCPCPACSGSWTGSSSWGSRRQWPAGPPARVPATGSRRAQTGGCGPAAGILVRLRYPA